MTPADVQPTEDALRAIADADVIVLGPGSLYTSLLPALLVPGIREAIEASGALVVFACNVATQDGETSGYDLADHLDALAAHGVAQLADVVLANNRFDGVGHEGWTPEAVRLRWPPKEHTGARLVLDDLVDRANVRRHDSERLAASIIRAWDREGGRRRRPAAARVERSA